MSYYGNGFRYALASSVDMEDELAAFREYKYFVKIVFPKIITDFLIYFKHYRPEVVTMHITVKILGDKKIINHYEDNLYTSEKEKCPLEVYINSKKYFMPEAMSRKAAAKFCIYLGHFLNDYELGYVYNSQNITIDKLDNNVYEYLFDGANDANIYLSNTIKQNLYAYYLEEMRLDEYECKASQIIGNADEDTKDKCILELMADDVIKGRKRRK